MDQNPIHTRRWFPWLGVGLILFGITEFIVGQVLLDQARAERTAEFRRNAVSAVAEVTGVIPSIRGEAHMRIAYTIDGQAQSTLVSCPTFDCSDEQVGDTVAIAADRTHPWRVITRHGEQYASNGLDYDYLVIICAWLPLLVGGVVLHVWRAGRRSTRPKREIDVNEWLSVPPR